MRADCIGVVGAGISGLQLALRLQQLGVPVVLYSEQDADGLASGRPRNFPARFAPTQEREEELGVMAWRFPDAQVHHWSVTVGGGDECLHFEADLRPPSSVVDFRIYLPHLFRTFLARGGEAVVGPIDPDSVARRSDLVVVADAGRALRGLFARDDARSAHDGPQRILCSGLYRGIHERHPHGLDLVMVPGAGEIFRIPFLSRDGRTDILAFEAVPGGPLEETAFLDADGDPVGYHRRILELLAVHAAEIRDTVDAEAFELAGPGEVAQGGVTPVVRRGHTQLADGTCALAVGDAWITNDPLTAQGANLGSWCAFALAGEIATTDGPLDAEFCHATSELLWEHAKQVVDWSTAFLAPPPPHVVRVLAGAAADRRVADAFVGNFGDPVAMWRSLRDPAGADLFLDGLLEGAR